MRDWESLKINTTDVCNEHFNIIDKSRTRSNHIELGWCISIMSSVKFRKAFACTRKLVVKI